MSGAKIIFDVGKNTLENSNSMVGLVEMNLKDIGHLTSVHKELTQCAQGATTIKIKTITEDVEFSHV